MATYVCNDHTYQIPQCIADILEEHHIMCTNLRELMKTCAVEYDSVAFDDYESVMFINGMKNVTNDLRDIIRGSYDAHTEDLGTLNVEDSFVDDKTIDKGTLWFVDGDDGGIVEYVADIDGKALVRDYHTNLFYGEPIAYSDLNVLDGDMIEEINEKKAVDDMMAVVGECRPCGMRETMRALYRAGYQKH